MKTIKYILAAIIFLFILFVSKVATDLFVKVEIRESDRNFSINYGQTVKEVSKALSEKGIIRSDYWFRTLVWFKKAESRFLAGDFIFPQKANAFDLFNILTTKGRKQVRTIKILEGWGINDIDNYLSGQGILKKGEFEFLAGKETSFGTLNREFYEEISSDFPILKTKPEGASLEGYLFPDTYEIYADSTAREIIIKMIKNFESKISQDMILEIEKQGKNFYDVLTMASIIEAEVPKDEDRKIVSGIFWSRMGQNYMLQSCATLNYQIGGTSPALTSEQLKIDSKYNTYMYKGLPPTPVGNPGVSSMMAAIYPDDTNYFYFLSTKEGKTIFSSTLEEHNRAKAKYLQ